MDDARAAAHLVLDDQVLSRIDDIASDRALVAGPAPESI
jgi:hypothetical protein